MSTRTPARRMPSRAAMQRKLADLEAAAAVTRKLDPALAEIVDSFDVSRYGACSQPIHPFLREAIRRSTLSGAESVRKHCRHLTALAVFCDKAGIALTVETVLTTASIEQYVRTGMNTDSDANRAERRRRLLWLASNVNPGPATPAKLAPIAHRAIKPPYGPKERATVLRAARTQPNERSGRQFQAAVALGFGAGADSVDLRHLWVRDILDHGHDGLTVTFHGERARTVWVRRVAEDLLRIAVAHRGPDELVIGQKLERRNTATRLLDAGVVYKGPKLDQARMRATWLADLMTDPIPVAIILQAAGLRSARSLVDVLPHLEPWRQTKNLPATSEDVLRGGAR